MPQQATLINTSLIPTSGTGTSSTRTTPFSRYTPARMVFGTGVIWLLEPEVAEVAVLTAAILPCDLLPWRRHWPIRWPPHFALRLPSIREYSDPENPRAPRLPHGCVLQSESARAAGADAKLILSIIHRLSRGRVRPRFSESPAEDPLPRYR